MYLVRHTGAVTLDMLFALFYFDFFVPVSRKTAPGGYVEFQDYGCELFLSDGTKLDRPVDGQPISKYIHVITSAAERNGRPLVIGRGMAERMKNAGFVDVQQQTGTWPLGPWPKQKDLKELGKWGRLSVTETALPFALMLLSREGWTQEEIKKLVDDTLGSIGKNHYYVQAWYVYGRKPDIPEAA